MKCPNCGHWNHVPVNKIFIEQYSPEPKVKALIPMYEPLRTIKCNSQDMRHTSFEERQTFRKCVSILNTEKTLGEDIFHSP